MPPETLARIDALADAQKEESVGKEAPDPESVAGCILAAANAEKPVTMTRLAKLAGYSYTQWFRDQVNALVESGWLIRSKKGVRLAKPPVARAG
jgi:hypothetical protein